MSFKPIHSSNSSIAQCGLAPPEKAGVSNKVFSHEHVHDVLLKGTNNVCSLFNTRIKLRLLTQYDYELYIELFSNKSVTRHTGGERSLGDLQEDFFLTIENTYMFESRYIMWTLSERNSDKNVGIVLLTIHDSFPQYGELGVMILPEFQNKGHAKQIVGLMSKVIKTQFGLDGILCFVEIKNSIARHVLQEFNFVPFKSKLLAKPSENGEFWRLLVNVH